MSKRRERDLGFFYHTRKKSKLFSLSLAIYICDFPTSLLRSDMLCNKFLTVVSLLLSDLLGGLIL